MPSSSNSSGRVRFIVADIGGTNGRFQLFEIVPELKSFGHGEALIAEHTYNSKKYKTFPPMVKQFLDDHVRDGIIPVAACLAVAGPVMQNRARVTNCNWDFTTDEVKKVTSIPFVSFLNDFEGIGLGLLDLSSYDLVPLNSLAHKNLESHSSPSNGFVKACIGAGTGLGECFLTYNGKEFDVWGAEGGHTTFGPRTLKEFQLCQHIAKTKDLKHVSAERIVSGMGLPDIFEFLCTLEYSKPNPEVKQKFNQLKEKDKDKDYDSIRSIVISDYALSKKCPVCVETMDLFISCFANEAANLALKTLPRGGLYIAGGMIAKLMWAAKRNNQQFLRNFIDKGRMSDILQNQIPVYVVMNQQVGLLGARVMARRLLNKNQRHKQELRSSL